MREKMEKINIEVIEPFFRCFCGECEEISLHYSGRIEEVITSRGPLDFIVLKCDNCGHIEVCYAENIQLSRSEGLSLVEEAQGLLDDSI